MAFHALEQRKKRQEQRRKEEEERLEKAAQTAREQTLRMFSHSMIVKANENPDASVEELVAAVTSEMEESGRN